MTETIETIEELFMMTKKGQRVNEKEQLKMNSTAEYEELNSLWNRKVEENRDEFFARVTGKTRIRCGIIKTKVKKENKS